MGNPRSVAALTAHLEERLAEAGLQVAIEASDGALILSGLVDTEEARQAAEDIVAQVAPEASIDNQLEVQAVLPTDVEDFAAAEPSAELAASRAEIEAAGGELEPDFIHRPGESDPLAIAGDDTDGPADIAQSGEIYTPPMDPVLRTDAHGVAHVLGGFDTDDTIEVEPSASDGRPGDEALADAVRRELAEDSATTDLSIVVAVRNGVAHLRGRVADLDDADNAESVAARVPGIREVAEELEVDNV
jgi:osmotically-inducible protein OsmY